MSDGKTDASVLHRWVYTMIPAGINMVPTFTAFCPNCRTLWSEIMPIPQGVELSNKNEWYSYPYPGSFSTSRSGLPKTGCVLPDGLPVA